MNSDTLCMSQIVSWNPVLHDTTTQKQAYLKCLAKYVQASGLRNRMYPSAQLKVYAQILKGEENFRLHHTINYYRYYLLIDLARIIGLDGSAITTDHLAEIRELFLNDFPDTPEEIVDSLQTAFLKRNIEKIDELMTNKRELSGVRRYLQLFRNNLVFYNKKPVRILVTATMSAGKSTFINSLAGKYICRSQNLACTGKIHHIYNKEVEDGHTYEYDHDLEMAARREELLNDNEKNLTNRIYVGTHFNSPLGKERFVISDTPGVNFSGNNEHQQISDRMISGRNYDLLIYIINATQIGTNDDSSHLDYVRRAIGRTPVIFVVNQIDKVYSEDEDLQIIVRDIRNILEEKRFTRKIICPVSCRAGYLAKKYQSGRLSRSEQGELYQYVDHFQNGELVSYYRKYFHEIYIRNRDEEEKQLLKTSGQEYLEYIIKSYLKDIEK